MSTWTVMVYMGADNLPTEKDLSQAARDDLAEMQKVGSNDQLTILVQIDEKTVGMPRRYRVLKDSLDLHRFEGDCRQIDMASPEVLESFLTWGFGYQEADHFLLILWGHSYRYAFGFDASAHGQSLDFTTLSGVLDRFKQRRGRNLDVLGFDACGVSAIEVAYQFGESVDYLVASEVGIPFIGWPYAAILERISQDCPAPEALSKGIVDDYLASTTQNVMLAALRLSEHPRVLGAMTRFSASLAVAVADLKERQIIVAAFDQALITRSEPLVDLLKLCDLLRTTTNDKDVMASAGVVRDLLSSTGYFVVAMDRRGRGTEGFGGVSAYAPHVTTSSERRITDKRYANLALSRLTLWPGVVGFLNMATY